MIAHLSGIVISKDLTHLVLNVNQVGYLISAPNQVIAETQNGQEIALFIHTHVREDMIALYGFLHHEELKFFKLLLTVSGIGPKVGLEIISTPLSILQNAIVSEDVKTLSKIPGLGKKTSERLILELKNKVEPLAIGNGHSSTLSPNVSNDAIEALTTLGYSRYHVAQVLSKMDQNLEDTESIVRYFLKNA